MYLQIAPSTDSVVSEENIENVTNFISMRQWRGVFIRFIRLRDGNVIVKMRIT